MTTNYKVLAIEISIWLRDYALDNNRKAFVVGVSGGIDSALVSTLCAMTGIKTVGVILPCHSKSPETDRGWAHMKMLIDLYPNVSQLEIDISLTFDWFSMALPVELRDKKAQLSFANDKSRLRMIALYHVAGCNDGLVVGTGNKVEDFGVGYFTKYGDGGVDLSPIADLTKTEVRAMARELGINEDILTVAPTDGLWDDARTDEQALGALYEELEWAMQWLEDGKNCYSTVLLEGLSARQKEVLAIYNKWHTTGAHKLNPIPTFKKKI